MTLWRDVDVKAISKDVLKRWRAANVFDERSSR